MREVKQRLGKEQQGTFKPEEVEGLRRLVGKLMKLPVKLAGQLWRPGSRSPCLVGWAQLARICTRGLQRPLTGVPRG